ncbi:hypothetical protein BG015_008018 [Linnemannia schmuckeri]|uniref:Transmembrane protein n=1 Tax=Linnemannia schmuckeri TaxID=64567 RepID=A0A9P5RXZ5_9FUNG|nr:hypothetical protein BG015_008018 [Linnemannia schmuckeri]
MNLFFVALDLLVAVSLGAALTHISQRTGGYTHSIRWIQQAGYYEMFTALKLSVRKTAGRSLLALMSTFAGSIALTAIIVGAKTFARSSIQEGNLSHEMVSSRQFVAFNTYHSLSAWVIPIDHHTSIEEALTKAINGTRVIPQANRPSKWYQPQRSTYEVVCDRFDFMTATKQHHGLLNENSCATVSIHAFSSGTENMTGSYIFPRSQYRGKVYYFSTNVPLVASAVLDPSIFLRLFYKGQRCGTFNNNMQWINATKVGLTSTPKTVLTKCLLDSGEMVSMSSTVIRFSVPNQEMFQSTATSIFGDQDELVLAMQESVNNGTLTNLPDTLIQHTVMEIKISGTKITALICVGSRVSTEESPHITCGYTNTNTLIINPRPMDPTIARLLPTTGFNPNITVFTNMMTLHHLPSVSRYKEPSFNFTRILNASSEAADYIASLGHSFAVDWDASMLYIVFNTVEILKGYEIPGWLFFLMVGVMVVCLIFWGTTEYWVADRYRQSLYFAVSKELTIGQDDVSPQLHRFDPTTLEFEGRRIVSKEAKQMPEEETGLVQRSIQGSQNSLAYVL